jgi:hypothetical protein
MFAALYGTLVRHPWRGPESEGDAYSLFYQRSLAMEWLDGVGSGRATAGKNIGAGGLWSMNDAGWDHPLASAKAQLAAWFQVQVEAVAYVRPLPFSRSYAVPETRQIALVCYSSGLCNFCSRCRVWTPSHVHQKLLYRRCKPFHWFRECNPRSRVRVEVGIDSGQDPVISVVARQFADQLDRLDQTVFVYSSDNAARSDAVLTPPFDDGLWNGPPLHGLTLRGELSEWTLDAIGWLGEVIADTSARLGVRSPLLVSVARDVA